MGRPGFFVAADTTDQARLFTALAEQLKTPLVHIARRAELGQIPAELSQSAEHLGHIQSASEITLQLIDTYLMSLRLQSQEQVGLEPVSVSAALQDVAHELSQLAKNFDTTIQLHIAGRYEPVLAHPAGFRAALLSLGHVIFESQPTGQGKQTVSLATHRSRTGIVAGVFSPTLAVNGDQLRHARHSFGHARMALPASLAGSGAGIFIADSLLRLMSSNVRVAHHQQLTGLGATMRASHQLALV